MILKVYLFLIIKDNKHFLYVDHVLIVNDSFKNIDEL